MRLCCYYFSFFDKKEVMGRELEDLSFLFLDEVEKFVPTEASVPRSESSSVVTAALCCTWVIFNADNKSSCDRIIIG